MAGANPDQIKSEAEAVSKSGYQKQLRSLDATGKKSSLLKKADELLDKYCRVDSKPASCGDLSAAVSVKRTELKNVSNYLPNVENNLRAAEPELLKLASKQKPYDSFENRELFYKKASKKGTKESFTYDALNEALKIYGSSFGQAHTDAIVNRLYHSALGLKANEKVTLTVTPNKSGALNPILNTGLQYAGLIHIPGQVRPVEFIGGDFIFGLKVLTGARFSKFDENGQHKFVGLAKPTRRDLSEISEDKDLILNELRKTNAVLGLERNWNHNNLTTWMLLDAGVEDGKFNLKILRTHQELKLPNQIENFSLRAEKGQKKTFTYSYVSDGITRNQSATVTIQQASNGALYPSLSRIGGPEYNAF